VTLVFCSYLGYINCDIEVVIKEVGVLFRVK